MDATNPASFDQATITLKSGLIYHYVEQKVNTKKPVIVLCHGFPGTFVGVWLRADED